MPRRAYPWLQGQLHRYRGCLRPRRWITRALEESLRRLQTDYIDLYQIHRPTPDTDIEETLSVLDDFVRAGKVRAILDELLAGAQGKLDDALLDRIDEIVPPGIDCGAAGRLGLFTAGNHPGGASPSSNRGEGGGVKLLPLRQRAYHARLTSSCSDTVLPTCNASALRTCAFTGSR
jgi:hypothetical protein